MKIVKLGDEFLAQNEEGKISSKMKAIPTIPTREKYIITYETSRTIGEIKRLRNSFGLYDLPRYTLSFDNKKEVTVRKDMEQFHSKYVIDGQYISIKGEFLGDVFSIYIKEKKYVTVRVEKNRNDFTFNLDISDEGMDELLIGFIYILALIYENEHYVVRV
ncbi:LURP-one-related/scramblase family protein [Pseudolactococcus reticulitermitis]|uniref:Tubby C 2 family protein n=1 Tax=Pseudolactococcus reticulitermitis TaxID=2025039 RepID=A0A224X0N7_9LACT|nr:hypothetical protein [Lactococcus reticulitermitis]GAX47788.1 hypothetical protein RsY01_1391 [Lactococcus reticulitermitis]